jgi:integrase
VPSDLVPVRNNPGIYKRNGSFVVRIWNPNKGQKGGWDNSTHGSLRDAKDYKRQAEAEKVAKRRSGRRQFTVREWAEEKWPELFGGRWKTSTAAYNSERVSWFVRDFADRGMHDITDLEAREWATAHPGRVRVVKTMFSDARKTGVVDQNPFELITHVQSRGRKDILVPTEQEVDRLGYFAGVAHGQWGEEVLAPMIHFAAGSGMRPGEIMALEASDVRDQGAAVHVWRQKQNKTHEVATTKNEMVRDVLLLPRARRALEQRLAEPAPLWPAKRGGAMNAQRLLVAWHDVRRLFTAELPDSHHLKRRIAAGKSEMDFYELRHFFGTALAHAGFTPFEIAAQMGHREIQTALRHYVHVDPSEIRKSMQEKLDRRYAA